MPIDVPFSSFPALLGILYLVAVAWPLAKTDLAEHRLPNRLVVPAFPVTLVGQLAALLLGEHPIRLALSIVIGLLSFGVGLLANRFAGLGMGDVKLYAAIALVLGWWGFQPALLALLLAFGLATIVVIWLLVTGKTKIGSSIPLGPYLLFGFIGAATLVLTGQG